MGLRDHESPSHWVTGEGQALPPKNPLQKSCLICDNQLCHPSVWRVDPVSSWPPALGSSLTAHRHHCVLVPRPPCKAPPRGVHTSGFQTSLGCPFQDPLLVTPCPASSSVFFIVLGIIGPLFTDHLLLTTVPAVSQGVPSTQWVPWKYVLDEAFVALADQCLLLWDLVPAYPLPQGAQIHQSESPGPLARPHWALRTGETCLHRPSFWWGWQGCGQLRAIFRVCLCGNCSLIISRERTAELLSLPLSPFLFPSIKQSLSSGTTPTPRRNLVQWTLDKLFLNSSAANCLLNEHFVFFSPKPPST